MSKVLGLDLGIASIGWSLMERDENGEFIRVVDLGSFIFPALEDKDGKLENVARRQKRSSRRLRRRKSRRLEDAKKLFDDYFNMNSKEILENNKISPFEIKVKGLYNKLSEEELVIALYHYMKYRGFKSNRKHSEEHDKEMGVLLQEIKKTKDAMDNMYISEYLLSKYNSYEENKKRIHNSSDNYYMTVSRDMYIDEINTIFDKQISYGVVNEEFRDAYLNIFTRQRDFSEGPGEKTPGKASPFGVAKGASLIEKMIGICSFDQKMRAPKNSYSALAFALLSELNNIRYKQSQEEKNYSGLTVDEINTIFEFAKTHKTLTYANIFKVIKKDVFRVKGLELSRKDYISTLIKYKEKNKITGNLDATAMLEFKKYANEQVLKKALHTNMATYIKTKDAFSKLNILEESQKQALKDFIADSTNFDKISYILLTNKTDTKIKEAIDNTFSATSLDAKYIKEVLLNLDEETKTINLSHDITVALIPHLLKGQTYDVAMKNLGYNHSNKNENIKKSEYLPDVDTMIKELNLSLTNVNVHHTLVQLRKVINAVIKKYGELDQINIEFLRDLKNNLKDRRAIQNKQQDNFAKNANLKALIYEKYSNHFKSIMSVKSEDVLKYKLYLEQAGHCAYSNEIIDEAHMFDDSYQIDHILPYSRSYDDSYNNKVLVTTEMNQIKRNKTPLEAFKQDMSNINAFLANPKIRLSQRKIDKILATEISDDFIERNKVDSSYIAKVSREMISAYLKPKCVCPSGVITSKLKNMWGLSRLTHSYINKDYKAKFNYLFNRLEIASKSVKFFFNVEELNKEVSFELKTKEAKNNYSLSQEEQSINNAIQIFNEYPSRVQDIIDKYKDESCYNILDNISLDNKNANENELIYSILTLFSSVNSLISIDMDKKNRDNHLHHALDACLIAVTNEKIIKRMSEFYKTREERQYRNHDKEYIDPETGEVIEEKLVLDYPYKDFRNEVMYRVYERDQTVLYQKLEHLEYYKENGINRSEVNVLLPVRQSNKNIKGAFTKETIFGHSNYKNGCITTTISTKSLGVKALKDALPILDKMVYKDKGNLIVFNSVLEWLNTNKNIRSEYPIHKNTGHQIRKIKVVESEDVQKRVQLKEKAFAANADVVRIRVYKSKNKDDEKLYFVPVFYYQLETEKNNRKYNKNKEVIYEIMWGSGKNSSFVNSKKLLQDFNLILEAPKYSLLELFKENGTSTMCYLVGLTSGTLEVKSILGDVYDVLATKFLSSYPDKGRIRPGVSTIKSIKVRSISVLGKLN